MSDQMAGEAIMKAFPWVANLREILARIQPVPFLGSHLMIGSDYSGGHASSKYNVYAYLVADGDLSPEWPCLRRHFREAFLPDGRRISYKDLGDRHRRRAIAPFLELSEAFTGLCCVLIVNKQLHRISSSPNSVEIWRSLHGLKGHWNSKSFESLARISHMFAVILGQVSRPFQHITWITDQDEIAANDDRLTDLLELTGKMSSLYLNHPMGELAVNTTIVDPGDRSFEDFVAIPDHSAGAFAELANAFSTTPEWRASWNSEMANVKLSAKAETIITWFNYSGPRLRKVAILIDRLDAKRYFAEELRFW